MVNEEIAEEELEEEESEDEEEDEEEEESEDEEEEESENEEESDDDEKEKTLFVKRSVKTYIKSKGCHTAKSVVQSDKLNDLIKEILDKACDRAQANTRRTVMLHDL